MVSMETVFPYKASIVLLMQEKDIKAMFGVHAILFSVGLRKMEICGDCHVLRTNTLTLILIPILFRATHKDMTKIW